MAVWSCTCEPSPCICGLQALAHYVGCVTLLSPQWAPSTPYPKHNGQGLDHSVYNIAAQPVLFLQGNDHQTGS